MATGNNNNLTARSYQLEFKELLPAVVAKRAYFTDFFAGGVEALDGVRENTKAFTIKTSDIPVVATQYSTNANVAFGTGTGNSSRFGNRTEIIYTNTDAEYTWEWAWHEGIDRATVNNDMDVAIADRMELQAQFRTDQFSQHYSTFIATNAAESVEVDLTDVVATFAALHKYYVNNHIIGTPVAHVTPDIYDALVDADLMTTAKGSTVNIDSETVNMCKGIVVEEYPEDAFGEGVLGLVYVGGIGKSFTGIVTARTVESEDFDGVAFQGHGKAGEYVLPDNTVAIVKLIPSA